MRLVPNPANFCERANRRGLRATRLYICRKNLLRVDSPFFPSLLTPLRGISLELPASSPLVLRSAPEVEGDSPALTRVNNFGRSISTGQASLHAPHRDEACANGTNSLPNNPAEMTEPIGPEYGLWYACPPISRKTGQAFRHAPQRMQ